MFETEYPSQIVVFVILLLAFRLLLRMCLCPRWWMLSLQPLLLLLLLLLLFAGPCPPAGTRSPTGMVELSVIEVIHLLLVLCLVLHSFRSPQHQGVLAAPSGRSPTFVGRIAASNAVTGNTDNEPRGLPNHGRLDVLRSLF
jgi:hypothetical protein